MATEIYWIQGKKNKEILKKTFYEELENEIEFWNKFQFGNQANILNGLKMNIDKYIETEQQQYLNNIMNNVNNWNSFMNLMYSTPYSVKISKEYIEKRLITNNSNVYRKLVQPQGNYILNNDDIIIYFEIVLNEKFQSSNIKTYQKLINEQYQKLEDLKEDVTGDIESLTKNIKEDVTKFQKEYRDIVAKNQGDIEAQYNEYDKLLKEHDDGVKILENKYQEKLKIDGPVKFWEEKSKDYKKSSNKWLISTFVVIGILLVSVIFLSCLIFDISYVSEAITITFKGLGKNITVGNVIIIAAIESIIIYAMKVCLKYYDYNLKLYEFYKSKAMLASFIVEIKDEDGIDNELIKDVYKEIFKMREINGEEVPSSGLLTSINKK